MHPPAFWYKSSSPLGLLFAPLGWLYNEASLFFRGPIKTERVAIPVVCVGNVTLGGAGKTPVVAALVVRLRELGVDAHVLSRGYGGQYIGPLRIDPATHTAAEVGDEPLMLSHLAPVWIAADKVAGAKAALKAGAKLLILDDGLQNPSLYKDFSLLVVDSIAGVGNGRIFPAGPLREDPREALKRIDAVLVVGKDAPPLAVIRTPKPVLRATPVTTLDHGELRGMKVYAFCGLGLPDKFFDGLRAQSAVVCGTKRFPDHHFYARAEIEQILREAEKLGATPVTTKKDSVRIPVDLLPRITVCGLRLAWKDDMAFEKLVSKIRGLVVA